VENFKEYAKALQQEKLRRNKIDRAYHISDYEGIAPKYQSFYAISTNYELTLEVCKSNVYLENESLSKYVNWVLENNNKNGKKGRNLLR